MKNLFKTTIALVIIGTFFTSCTTEETTPSKTEKSNEELLTSGNWLRTSMTISPGLQDEAGNLYTDALSLEEACERDNEVSYDSDGTGIYLAGDNRCYESEDDIIYTFNWRLSDDNKRIIEDDEEYSILEISEKRMILEYKTSGEFIDGANEGEVYTLRLELVRI